MSAPIPTIEPLELRAGTKADWTKSLSDFSYSDGWRLTYYLRGVAQLDIATTADTDGKGFAASISVADSSTLQAGDYWLVGEVVSGSDTREVYRGTLAVLVNISTATAGYDGRTHAKRMLDAIEAAEIQQDGTYNIAGYSIDGERSVTFAMNFKDLMEQRGHWEDKVNWERKAEQIARGRDVGVKIRFR